MVGSAVSVHFHAAGMLFVVERGHVIRVLFFLLLLVSCIKEVELAVCICRGCLPLETISPVKRSSYM